VKLLESMKTMDEDSFRAYFGDELLWTATLSDGSVVQLKSHDEQSSSASLRVHFNDRLRYIALVKEARMNESRQQVGPAFCRVVSILDSGAEGPGSNRSRDAVG